MNIGCRLKDARKLKGMSQEKLASQLGCSRGVVTNIESNKTMPSQLVLDGLCSILNLNKEWLLHGTGHRDREPVSRSAKILAEITAISKELSQEEQLYVLDLINSFKKHKDSLKK